MTTAVALVSPAASGVAEKSLGGNVALDPAAVPFTTKITVPAEASGDYTIEVRLRAEGEAAPPAARAGLVKALPVHIEALAADARRLRDRLSKDAKKTSPALPSAQYALEFYERADRGEASPGAFRFREELPKPTRFWTPSRRAATRLRASMATTARRISRPWTTRSSLTGF